MRWNVGLRTPEDDDPSGFCFPRAIQHDADGLA
jgi:hypothetical protein